jgi:hypothetical protein
MRRSFLTGRGKMYIGQEAAYSMGSVGSFKTYDAGTAVNRCRRLNWTDIL